MLTTILGSLLPLIVTFLFGIFAAWRGDFDVGQATTFNRLVMRYALPLNLFVGTVVMSPEQLSADGPLAIAGGMIGSFVLSGAIAYLGVSRPNDGRTPSAGYREVPQFRSLVSPPSDIYSVLQVRCQLPLPAW